MIQKISTLALALLLTNVCLAQQKYTISGYIKEASSGETLLGASVFVRELSQGTVTNEYGFYSLALPAGQYTLEYSYVGYETLTNNLSLNRNLNLDVELPEQKAELAEIVISAERENENVSSLEMSVNKLDIQTIQKMPALLGEVDLIKSVQFLPGISTVGEGAPGYTARGGSIDQNLVLLDEAPVYNSSHLFGFFSVFNPDAVKDVKLIKGGIPAQYGGRLSSILDVRMKEGNSKHFTASGGVGLIFSRLTLEAPIVRDKASFIVAGRRSYLDVIARPFLNDDLKNSVFNFYDLTLKTNFNINPKNQVFLSGYFGRDKFGTENTFDSSWGNATATLRWNRIINSRLFSKLTIFYSNYDYALGFGEENDSFDWESSIINYSIKPELNFYLNPNNSLVFGGQAIFYDFDPGNAVGVSAGEVSDISLDRQYGL
ncbi:MAG: TonB-dependent receptor, partial [Bacteroidia bacterium]|nr:TonB-dependent receptor [Bacteroidia bacterium]